VGNQAEAVLEITIDLDKKGKYEPNQGENKSFFKNELP